jgi:hypothetical protein
MMLARFFFANPVLRVNLFVPDTDIGPRTIYYVYLLDRGLDLGRGVSHPRVIVTRYSNHYQGEGPDTNTYSMTRTSGATTA